MADAKKCDRCGGFYTEVEPNALDLVAAALRQLPDVGKLQAKQAVVEKFLDLCPSCSASLARWLKGKED